MEIIKRSGVDTYITTICTASASYRDMTRNKTLKKICTESKNLLPLQRKRPLRTRTGEVGEWLKPPVC